MIGSFSYLDVALFSVAVLSGLLAMYRGFTREVLSILSWALAAGAVLYFVLNYKKEAEQLATQLHAPVPVAGLNSLRSRRSLKGPARRHQRKNRDPSWL